MTSGTISKAVSLVRSGIFRATLKPAETNYDYMLYRFTHVSAADQVLVFQTVNNDDSDIVSYLSDIHSDLKSYMVALSATISDIYSMLSDTQSDFQSRVPKLVATNSQLSDLQSDLRSFLVVMSGIQSDILSAVSDLQSDFQSRVPKRVATDSQLSDMASDLNSKLRSLVTTTGVNLNASTFSDLRSAITGVTATISASDISDIASAVRLVVASDLSDILSAATQINSRVLVGQSTLSDITSDLSDLRSDLKSLLTNTGVNLNASTISDIRSAIAGVTATLSASDISDIASAVWANTIGARVDSRILVNQSSVSDIVSFLSDFRSDLASFLTTTGVNLNASAFSDIRSAIAGGPAGVLTASDISDLASAVRALMTSDLSDILSAAVQINSRALVNKSAISDIYSMLSDFQSDFGSRVPKRVATDSQLSNLNSALLVLATGNSAILSDILSEVSDIQSDLRSLIVTTGANLNTSVMSDLRSAIAAGPTAGANASDISDILSAIRASYSLVSDFQSDFQSRVTGVIVTASDMASQVWNVKYTNASNVKASTFGSMARLNMSRISDVQSFLSDYQSDLYSLLNTTGVQLNASALSDIRSAITAATVGISSISDIASAVRALVSSDFSDIYSLLSDFRSDLLSVLNTTGVQVNASSMSDLRSAITAGAAGVLTVSDISDIASAVRNLVSSDFSDIYSQAILMRSDLLSFLQTTGVQLNASTMSDLRSAMAAGPAGVLTASDISDIASAVRTVVSSDLSDIYSQAVLMRSDLLSLLNLTGVQLNASVMSDLRSAILTGPVGALTTSDISDIASAVGTLVSSDISDILSAATQINSRVLVSKSVVSDIYSLLSDHDSLMRTTGVPLNASAMSDLRSAITGVTLTASDISDIASAVRAGIISDTSDIYSAIAQVNSRVLVNKSTVSDIYSLLSDVQSDFQSRVPKRVATDSQLSDLSSDLKSMINGVPAAIATRVAEGAITWEQIMRLVLAAEGGKTNGAGTGTFHIRDSADTKNRVTAANSGGNRTAVTLDLT